MFNKKYGFFLFPPWKNPSPEKAEANCTREQYNGSLPGSKATGNKQVSSSKQERKPHHTPPQKRTDVLSSSGITKY